MIIRYSYHKLHIPVMREKNPNQHESFDVLLMNI